MSTCGEQLPQSPEHRSRFRSFSLAGFFGISVPARFLLYPADRDPVDRHHGGYPATTTKQDFFGFFELASANDVELEGRQQSVLQSYQTRTMKVAEA